MFFIIMSVYLCVYSTRLLCELKKWIYKLFYFRNELLCKQLFAMFKLASIDGLNFILRMIHVSNMWYYVYRNL